MPCKFVCEWPSESDFVNIFVMCAAMLSLASCNSDDNVERRLTTNQKERYAQNISGEYSGKYIIIYKDKDCTDMTTA